MDYSFLNLPDFSFLDDLDGDNSINNRNTRIYKARMNPLRSYNDLEFKKRYRITKKTFTKLMSMLPDLQPVVSKRTALDAEEQVLLTIHYMATGAFLSTVADHINVFKTTASRVVNKISLELTKLRPKLVKMPETPSQRDSIRNDFYKICSFPRTIGAIDCMLVKILSPGGKDAELFRCKKGYSALNVQMVCDSKLRITNIICRYPGSVPDMAIFNNSPLREEFEMGKYENDVLLGDGDYPCRKYLLTPFSNPTTSSQIEYNRAHIATLNPIEQCFQTLKRRFPCLANGLRVKLNTSMRIIVACTVLHNLALQEDDGVEEFEEVHDDTHTPENDEATEVTALPIIQRNDDLSVRNSLLISNFNLQLGVVSSSDEFALETTSSSSESKKKIYMSL